MSLKEHLVVEAAHGVIAELLTVDIDTAGRVLDGYVSRSGRSLHEVATDVADRSLRLIWIGDGDPRLGPAATLEVLYIGDEQRNTPLMEQILSRWPMVELAATPLVSQGLDAIRQHRPDLVLLDGSLPDPDGREVLRRIRSDPSTAALPVVVVSGDEGRQRAVTFLAAGANRYLTSPIDLASLDQLIIDHTTAARSASSAERT